MVAKTKAQAISFRESQIKFGYEIGLIKEFGKFLKDIGGDGKLPTDSMERLTEIKRLHESLSVNNGMFPSNLPFQIVYPPFFTAVVNRSIERKGSNIGAVIEAFKLWISSSEIIDMLTDRHRRDNPEYKSSLKLHKPEETKEDNNLKGKNVNEFEDQDILDLYKQITTIYSGEAGRKKLEACEPGKFFHTVITEAQKRNLI